MMKTMFTISMFTEILNTVCLQCKRISESVLIVMYDKFRNLGKIVKNSYGPIIFNFAFLKTGTIAACFHK
jgi:hypothetical protein